MEKDNDGTMRQKHPQNPTQNILFVLTVQHTQVVSLNLSDFRMEGGPLDPTQTEPTRNMRASKKGGGNSAKGGSKLEFELLSLPQWSHFLFLPPLCLFNFPFPLFIFFSPSVFPSPFWFCLVFHPVNTKLCH